MQILFDVLGIVLDLLVLAVCAVLIYLALLRLSIGHPRFEHRLRTGSLWVSTHVVPGFWQWFEPKVAHMLLRLERWWERDPAEQRGE